MKKIAVLADYLEPSHHALIDSTAARCGFAVDYYPDGRVPAELARTNEVVDRMPNPRAQKAVTGLKWLWGRVARVGAKKVPPH